MKRCDWTMQEIMIEYHDTIWGNPEHDDQTLFEFLILDGAQAGLSWLTILKKRESYREAFDQWDIETIARYGKRKTNELLKNPGIIRNKLKVASAIQNAQAFLKVQEEFGSFDSYIWDFVDGKPIQNKFKTVKEIPAKTDLSDTISKDMKKRGFNFVGSTIVYAWIQSIGLVNDHIVSCFRHKEVKAMGKK